MNLLSTSRLLLLLFLLVYFGLIFGQLSPGGYFTMRFQPFQSRIRVRPSTSNSINPSPLQIGEYLPGSPRRPLMSAQNCACNSPLNNQAQSGQIQQGVGVRNQRKRRRKFKKIRDSESGRKYLAIPIDAIHYDQDNNNIVVSDEL